MNRYIPAPASPAPLSQYNAYTTWPGGVDPTAALFKTDNQRGGRKSRRQHSRRAASRKHRRNTRRHHRRAGRR